MEKQNAEQIERLNNNEDGEEEGLQTEANTSKGDEKKINIFREQIAVGIIYQPLHSAPITDHLSCIIP